MTTTTMKAAQLTEYKKPYSLREIPVPKATGRDILVKVYAASFCHTDVPSLSSTVSCSIGVDGGRSKLLMERPCMEGIPCPLRGVMRQLGSSTLWVLRSILRDSR